MKIRGFSLVEIMVSLALTSILTLGISYGFIKVAKRSVDIKKKSMENILKTGFINYIINPKNCNEEFSRYYLPLGGGGSDPFSNPSLSCTSNEVPTTQTECNMHFANYKGYGDEVPIKVGSEIEEAALKISTFKMTRKSGTNVEQIKDRDGLLLKERHFVRIYLGFTNTKDNKKLKVTHADLLVTVNPSDQKIESCGELGSDQLCRIMGGEWDSLNSKCTPSSQCWLRGVYVNASSSDSGRSRARNINNPFTGGINCEPGATAMKMGSYGTSYSVHVYKKHWTRVTDTYTSYMCLQCNY